MFANKTLIAILIVLLLFENIIAQQNPNLTNKQSEISAQLQKDTVDFLRQTIKEIPNLKSEENQQFFTIETARLLRKYDEKTARQMLEQVMYEVKKSLGRTAEKYKKAVEEFKKQAQVNANINYGANSRYPTNAANAAYNSYYANRASNKIANTAATNAIPNYEPEINLYATGFFNEFRKLSNLRKSLIENLIESDPNLAYQFLTETSKMMPKELEPYSYTNSTYGFENRIIYKMLEKNEVDKALQIARDILARDFSEGFLSILNSIYEKDAVKGSTLAEETLQKLRISPTIFQLTIFFNTAESFKDEPQPLLNDKSLHELAKLLGQIALTQIDGSEPNYPASNNPLYYARRIKEYAPRESLQLLQKSKQKRYNNSNRISNTPYYATNRAYPANYSANYPYAMNTMANRPANYPPVNALANVANAVAIAANRAANASYKQPKTTPTPQIIESIPPNEFEWENKDSLIQKLRIGKFTAEERKAAIKLAKEYAFASNPWGYSRADGLVSVVAELARFSLFSADKEIADALMKEAETYVRPETSNALDYAKKLMLAGGYSSHQPEKSFAIIESLVSINEVIEHAVKLGVFLDMDSTYMQNDEVSALYFLGEFGAAQAISREGELPMFIQNLAQADFQRTKGLADKFAKPEFKMTAKMLILESLLGEIHNNYRDYNY
ncbi:MAG TPA: hypothetical protein PKY82_00035 [Pyrinomonadaceae bacterium]|nr:hypothetical protein [Pyrinomonadaceae bacterium]